MKNNVKENEEKTKTKNKRKTATSIPRKYYSIGVFPHVLPLTYNFLLSDTDQQSEVPNIIIKFACKVNSFIYTALLLAPAEPEGLW